MKTGQIISLDVHGIGSGGEGVGDHNGSVIFIEGALPGERVTGRLKECKKRYGFAELLSIERLSPDRIAPLCPLFGRCGGCQLMHLAYPKQLEMKRQRVIDALQRIGKVEAPVAPCLASPAPLAYRNKIQLPVQITKKGLSLGLYARSSHHLVEIDTCPIHCKLGDSVYQIIIEILKRYRPKLRHLLIKSAERTDEVLIILVSENPPCISLYNLAKEILTAHPSIKGVVHNLHSGSENVILGASYRILAGSDSIRERLGDLTFQISAASFFQVNPGQAERLYQKALEFAELGGKETVLDAYCGVGTLSLFFAKKAKKVFGVECVPQAIENARHNARLNNIRNATFVCASAATFVKKVSSIDLALLNPPRKGCDISFLDEIKKLAPRKVIYISCDPATLARDLSYLKTVGYHVDAIQPFDMFPQTAHVECVARLHR